MLPDELFTGFCVVFAVRVMHVDTHIYVGNGEEPSRAVLRTRKPRNYE